MQDPHRISNREDLPLTLSVNDDDNGQPIDMVALGWAFQFEIRDAGPRDTLDGYLPYYNGTTIDTLAPILTASLTGDNVSTGTITIVDIGVLRVFIPEKLVKTLRAPQTYLIAMSCTDGTETRQLYLDRLQVVYGGVTN
jgi:hypothetical protein